MRIKTGNEITETIIMGIFWAGTITVALPLFSVLAIPKIIEYTKRIIKNNKNKRDFYNVFSRLKKQGLIKIINKNGQIYISLTTEGKKKAGKYQVDNLEIKKSKKWDKKWRILIFDIMDKQRIKREALRGKIKELGMFQLQKSVWIHPYDFTKEINLLRSFFGLTKDEMQIITASNIENDGLAKKFFGLK
jgi:DNA-binding transcriptional regulator PaaX